MQEPPVPTFIATERPGRAERGVSVEEMGKDIRDAPMSDGVMFYAEAQIRLPQGLDAVELQSALEALAGSLMEDISLRRES